MDNELEKLQIKCRAYEKEIEFLRCNMEILRLEKENIETSKLYILMEKIRKLMWWRK